MKHRGVFIVQALLCCVLAACSKDSPVAPGTRAVSGRLDLRGYYVDRNGSFAGTRVIGDADGIPVELLYGTEVIARTTTAGGGYRFTGIRPGGYVARTRIIPGIEDETRPLVVADRDLEVRDTLKLASLGDLYPVPNPFVDSIRVVFQIWDSARVELAVRDVAGRKVRTLLDLELRRAVHTVYWTMRDPIPAGKPTLYWLTLDSGPDIRAQLLVREPRVPQLNE